MDTNVACFDSLYQEFSFRYYHQLGIYMEMSYVYGYS